MELPPLDFEPTMPVFLRRAAAVHGDGDFVVMIDRRLSYRQAEERSRAVAKQLLATGVVKGTRIAIHFGNTTEWMIAFLAITRIGAIVVPLSTAYKPVELRKALRHSDAHTLIVPARRAGQENLGFVEQALPSVVGATGGPLYLDEAPYLRRVLVSGATDREWAEPIDLGVEPTPAATEPSGGISDAFVELVEAEVTPADWIMFVYTSGTTAEPKGVIHTHGNYIRHNSNLSQFLGVNPASKVFAGMPWFWIGGLGLGIGNSMYAGFPLVAIEQFEPKEALALIKREKPVAIGMWAQLLQRFNEYVAASGEDVSDVPVLATPAVPMDMGLRHNSLGQTETFGPHTGRGKEPLSVLPEEMRGSFGMRVPYIEHKIVDPETLRELPEGEDGELLVRGYSILAGLYKREKHEAFTDDGWLRTGDKCHFRDDILYFKGRIGEMIKTSGSNVAPREVELVLESYPEVALAVVLGIPDERRGEAVACVLVPASDATLDSETIETIRARANEELSNYKVPTKYLVLLDSEMPTLGSGKPDKVKLRVMLAESE